MLLYKEKLECKIQKNRQNSIEITSETASMYPEQIDLATEWQRRQVSVQNASKTAYQWAIENGIAKEQARAVLPEGMTVSRMYMNGTLRSWAHFINLRSGNGTQKECMEVAKEAAKVLEPIFPMITDFVK